MKTIPETNRLPYRERTIVELTKHPDEYLKYMKKLVLGLQTMYTDIANAVNLNALDHDAIIYPSWHSAGADDADAINKSVEEANANGGGIVQLGARTYILNEPILALSNVWLRGVNGTILDQRNGAGAVSQVTGGYVTNFKFSDAIINYNHATPSQSHVGLLLRSMNYSRVENIYFTGFDTSTGAGSNDGQILVKVVPDYTGSPAQNFIANSFDHIVGDAARIGLWYEGLDGGSTPNADPASGSYVPTSVISGNTWNHFWVKSIHEKGIHAKQWADSEVFDSIYFQAAENGVTLIDLNTDASYWWQIDRFVVNRARLVYHATTVTSESTCKAIRLGPGVFKTEFRGVISDKTWTNFFDDSTGAASVGSYYISGDVSGGGYSGKPISYSKNWEDDGSKYIVEKSADPADPAEGRYIIWMSDGTGSGDDGDIMIKITAGGSTKTATLADFSTL